MRISELSSPDVRQLYQDPVSILLSQIESLTKETERLSQESSVPEHLSSDLRRCLSQLAQLTPFNNTVKLQIWKLSYRLWNACVDLSNSISIRSSASGGRLGAGHLHAEIRQVAAGLLSTVTDVSGVPSPELKAASFYCKTGSAWHDLGRFDLASDCFEKATNLTSKIEIATVSDREEQKLLFDLNIARSRTAWGALDRTLAITLLNRSKKFLFESAEKYAALANQCLVFGKALLSKDDTVEKNMPLKLMNDALELCEKGLRVVKRSDETLSLKHLRDKTLRFIAALHLQQEEFESVIKCVRVLRANNGSSCSDSHPSLSVLAMKAWLGLGRHGDAEKELRGMIVNKGVPEKVWVSAIEAYFKTVGMAGGDTIKSVFMGLLGRCQVSPSAAIRVIYKVVGGSDSAAGSGGEMLQLRAKLAAELASDDRVVVLFSGDTTEKERTALHAILWNCASSHFRLKDYRISAELYEKSLLYLPHGIEDKTLRAKGFRVLCLCHLGLGQLDQAYEYIDEAQKLEPNVTCSFLKLKVYLQRKDHDGAIAQMHALSSCADFTVDFLYLAVHEAVSSRALPVAIASLSNLLNFYSSGNPMAVPEIVVLRTLVTILLQDPGNEQEILMFMKKAEARAIELGPDNFFGKGEVGRRERNWIALNSWNLGTSAGTKKNYQLCAEFMRLAFDFYSIRIDEDVNENNVMVCNAIILTVCAMIADEKQNNVPLQEAEVKKAIELLDRAGKILASTGNKMSDFEDSTIDPSLQFIYTVNLYELYGRLKDSASQHLIVKNFSTSKACNPTHLLHIGIKASQGPYFNPEVATFTLTSCLSSLLASPEPDYQKVALATRRLITVSGVYKGEETDDEVIYGLYKQAYRVMVGLKESEFPVEEGKWLATTAWNRASCSVRLGHDKSAKKWMAMGLELAMNVRGMDSYKASMEEFMIQFEKKSRVQEMSPG